MSASDSRTTLTTVFIGASLLLLAVNLRPLFPSAAILLPEIQEALGLSRSAMGYLTTLPVLCMGLFAPLAPRLAHRIGMERTLLLVLAVIVAGTLLRGGLGASGLFIGTALAGAGIAVGNVLLPSLVKRDFANHTALMTGLYTMSLAGGAAVAAAATLPLTNALGGQWQVGLGVWAVLGLAGLCVWIPLALRTGRLSAARTRVGRVSGLYRDPLAWAVTVLMGLQSALAYCVFGWLAAILRYRGVGGVEAGLVTSVSVLLQIVSCLVVPALATRFRDQRGLAASLCLLTAVSFMGLLIGPLWAIWPLAAFLGLVQGGLFALCLMLLVLRAPDTSVAAHLSSMAQTTGYVLASIGPLLMGLLLSTRHGFAATAAFVGAIGVAAAAAAWIAGRNQLVKAKTLD